MARRELRRVASVQPPTAAGMTVKLSLEEIEGENDGEDLPGAVEALRPLRRQTTRRVSQTEEEKRREEGSPRKVRIEDDLEEREEQGGGSGKKRRHETHGGSSQERTSAGSGAKDRERIESPVTALARQGSWAKSFKMRGEARNDAWETEDSISLSLSSSASALGIRRIWLIRHAQSEGNADKKLLHSVADHALKLSKEGVEQAKETGRRLKAAFMATYGTSNLPHVRMWVSPFRRTRQTAEIVAAECGKYITSTKEHLLLAEQQFGLFEGMEAAEVSRDFPTEHKHFEKMISFGGRFWARPPLGESRYDVATRVHQAFGSFHRDAERFGIRDLVIVTHGVTLRAFLMMWLHRTPEWFEQEKNPGNGCIRLIEDYTDKGYTFDGFDEFRRAKRSAPEPTVTINQSLDLEDGEQKQHSR